MTHSSHDVKHTDVGDRNVCRACGGMYRVHLDAPCPAVHAPGVIVTNTARAGETPEQTAARYHRAPTPAVTLSAAARADLVAFAKKGGPRVHRLDLDAEAVTLAAALRSREDGFSAGTGYRRRTFDLIAHLERQRQFSFRTFGPGNRTKGVVDHIRKELREIEAAPHDLKEWVDVILLALDGAWRCGHSPEQIATGIDVVQTRNEGRTWPDWRTADPDKAIEHDRRGEVR